MEKGLENRKILVTSALPYANGPLHVGHIAGAYIPADVYVRYLRMRGADVIFICGSDEHGVPITLSAEREGTTPQAIVDEFHPRIKKAFDALGMSFENYSRTSLPQHYELSREFFLSLYEQGFMAERVVEQQFCPKCERFLPDRYVEGTCPLCGKPGARGDQCESCGKQMDQLELIDPICMICGTQPVVRETKHLFLQLGKFEKQLRSWLGEKKEWKDNVRNFCIGLLNEGLVDRPVTRDMTWGVPVPVEGFEGKVIYVWFDAPIGYISSTVEWAQRVRQPDLWEKYWKDPETRMIHFLGKDNIVYHAIIWPAMLMGVGDYVMPANIPANEYMNIQGRKISTSRNYAVWVEDYVQKFPPDLLRYYVAVNAPETKDADFSWRDLQRRNNDELADNLGNFVNRTMTFNQKQFGGAVPEPGAFSKADEEMLAAIGKAAQRVGDALERFQLRKAARGMMDLPRAGNKYFNDEQPWKTLKEDPERCRTTLYVCLQVVHACAKLMSPFIPFTADRLWATLNQEGSPSKARWNEIGDERLAAGTQLAEPKILFPKIENEDILPEIEKLEKIAQESEQKTVESKRIPIDDFKKLDVRVAEVVLAEPVKGANKLLRLEIKIGDETRQIVAGIAQDYEPEELIGKQIVVLANLEPATIRGVESNGMLLAATDSDGNLAVLTPDRAVGGGARIS